MRHWLTATAVLALAATPGLLRAQTPSTFDQYQTAKAGFLGGEIFIDEYTANHRKVLFAGIEGRWYPASVVDPEDAEDDRIPMVCRRIGVNIRVQDEYTLSFVLDEGRDSELETLFTSRGGSVFGQYTDATALLHRLGLDRPNMEEIAVRPLASYNGIATIVRPSPDILVVQANLDMPIIYARCAAS